ncbi:hypothetical protein Kisp01_70490 [Kineosporia sp. NBRC 101677]|uniref:replication-relaxation family protein n=1 Tax=Kineosporia sp. NBRC 101677 TaxID=3032197 RepID=UPI0024A544AB|nr:replication-relaxation family protein [Kineosporia sp. NBRC 101677]GLY20035.1 hypothetical protein Kisp01_70490 [Kineosporia sp. NBRC 101677]
MSGTSAARGRSRSAYLQALQRLSARDHVLMQLLHEHTTLTSPQITALLFASPDSARGRLARLRRQGWVTNFHTQRAGRRLPEHWVLDQWGSRWAAFAAEEGEPTPRAVRTRNEKAAASSQLEHTDGIHDFFVALIAATRAISPHQPDMAAASGPTQAAGAARVARWWSAARTAREVGAHVHPDGHGVWEYTPLPTTTLAAHPMTGPAADPAADPGSGPAPSAGDKTTSTVELPGDRGSGLVQVGFYLEYDRGTEPLGQLADKLGPYQNFCGEGQGPDWPVLIVVPTRARERHLHEYIRQRRSSNPTWPAAPPRPAAHPYAMPGPPDAWRQDQAASTTQSAGSPLAVLTTSRERITDDPLGPAGQIWQPMDGFEPRARQRANLAHPTDAGQEPAGAHSSDPGPPLISAAAGHRVSLSDLETRASSQRLWDPGPPRPQDDPLFGLGSR